LFVGLRLRDDLTDGGDRQGSVRPVGRLGARATVECVTASGLTGARLPAPGRVDPLRFFSAEQVGRARSYHRPLYWSAAVELTLATAFLTALAWSAAGSALDPGSLPWWARTLAYVSIIIALSAALGTPLGFWRGYLRERSFGFSTQTARGWLIDRIKAVGINLVLVPPLLLAFVALARALPGWWVAPAAAAFALAVFVLSCLAPVLLAPLFNRFVPLKQEPLRSELHALARAAGVPVEAVHVEDTSRRTRKANAYVTGLGRTRRLVVSDTLLADASPAEIHVVVAHELGHRKLRHVLLGTLLSLVGAVVATVLVWALLGTKVADPRRLPLLLLITLGLTLVTGPAANALSRRWERRADRFALELTGDRAAYEQAFRRLAASNLSDLDPPKLVYLLLFTHPTPPQRLAASAE
jgi:Zn-dependent protease with chaperone function